MRNRGKSGGRGGGSRGGGGARRQEDMALGGTGAGKDDGKPRPCVGLCFLRYRIYHKYIPHYPVKKAEWRGSCSCPEERTSLYWALLSSQAQGDEGKEEDLRDSVDAFLCVYIYVIFMKLCFIYYWLLLSLLSLLSLFIYPSIG